MLRRLLAMGALITAIGFVGAGSPAGAAPRPQGSSAPCTFRIASFAFHPRTVHEGATTRAVLVLVNCTDHRLSLSVERYGHIACVTLDPVVVQVNVPPQ